MKLSVHDAALVVIAVSFVLFLVFGADWSA